MDTVTLSSPAKGTRIDKAGPFAVWLAVVSFLLLASAYVLAGAQTQDSASALEALKSRLIPVESLSAEDGTVVVKLNYSAAAEITSDRIRNDILEVFRQIASGLASARNIRVEVSGEGTLVFELKADARDVLDFATGRMTEGDFQAGVERTDRLSMSEIVKEIDVKESGQTGARELDKDFWADEKTESQKSASGEREPVAFRLLSFAAAAILILAAIVLILRMLIRRGKFQRTRPPAEASTELKSQAARPHRSWHSFLLPSLLALLGVGLVVFAFITWQDDGFFDPDLETLSAWLFFLAGVGAASASLVLFRKPRSGWSQLLAALFFFIALPAIFWLFFYLSDEVFVSTATMFLRGNTYETGAYGEKNEQEAAKWFLRAAKHGHVGAMDRLAVMYEEGRGVAPDRALAEEWRRKAREMREAR